jgi:hypothetical protein
MRRVNPRTVVVPSVAVAIGLAFTLGVFTIDAHKAVTSPYSYNEDVFPIVRDKCGRCHVEGGIAPMSLLTYREDGGAVAWAQSIREMLVAEAMPPWYVDATGPAVEHTRTLTARELDILVTWASGGAPEGDPARTPSATAPAQARWTLGPPDLVLPMPAKHEVPANMPQQTFSVDLPTKLTATRWVKAADLLPGTPTMVRRAVISVAGGPVLAVWEPGDDTPVTPAGTAFRLPAGATLHLEIFYKKPWQDEQQAKTDQSRVGLYFANPPASGTGIDVVTVKAPETVGDGPVSFGASAASSVRVLAVRPQIDRLYASMEITAVAASGSRVPILKLNAVRPEWPRRYWLVNPVELSAGTKIEVTGTPGDADIMPPVKATSTPLQVVLDVVVR